MNKIVRSISHVSDIHCRNYIRQDEYYECLKRFITKNKTLKPDRIVMCGDILHQKNTMSPELVQMVSWFFKKCCNICPVILIPGNHDANLSNKDRLDGLTPIVDTLNLENLWYFKESGCYQDTYDSNTIYVAWSCLDDQKDPNLKKYKEKYDKNNKKTYIGLFHEPVYGSKTDIGYKFDTGTDIETFIGCDIVMMGDIHKYQEFILYNKDGSTTPVVYSSSLIQQSFGEGVDYHGFLFWDINNRTYDFHKIENDYGYYTFNLDGFDNLNNYKVDDISKKPNIRVIWRDKGSNYSTIRVKEIKSHLQKKYNPINITVIFESTDSNSFITVKQGQVDNINNQEIQQKLMINFLLENGQLDDQEVEIEVLDEQPDKEIQQEICRSYSK
jgi:DNA repair exonuclease SbcCD nuclease subunit